MALGASANAGTVSHTSHFSTAAGGAGWTAYFLGTDHFTPEYEPSFTGLHGILDAFYRAPVGGELTSMAMNNPTDGRGYWNPTPDAWLVPEVERTGYYAFVFTFDLCPFSSIFGLEFLGIATDNELIGISINGVQVYSFNGGSPTDQDPFTQGYRDLSVGMDTTDVVWQAEGNEIVFFVGNGVYRLNGNGGASTPWDDPLHYHFPPGQNPTGILLNMTVSQTAEVPAPATLAILGLAGLGGLVLRARRKK